MIVKICQGGGLKFNVENGSMVHLTCSYAEEKWLNYVARRVGDSEC